MSGQTPSQAAGAVSRIVLTGFMGAGKTTVGSQLAARLGWTFLDSDHVVEARAGKTVAEIFECSGEPAFREMEAAAIRECLAGERLVLALGGGALEHSATRDLLAGTPNCLVVFLEASLETLVARCTGNEGAVRPVLADRSRLAARWAARLPWYRQADCTISTGDLTPQEIVGRIADFLDHPLSGDNPDQSPERRTEHGVSA